MPATLEELKAVADELPDAERAELATYLLDGLEEDQTCDQPPSPALQGEEFLAELDRQSDEIDAGTAVLTPWLEVRERLQSQLGVRFDD